MRHSMHILNQKQKAAVNIVDIYALSLSRKDILGILAYRVTKYSELRAIGGTVVLFEIQRNCTSRIVYIVRENSSICTYWTRCLLKTREPDLAL